jgi:hypothetical protein
MNKYIEEKNKEIKELENKIKSALEIMYRYALIDGEHHKMWVIDQVARKLLGNFDYKIWADKDWETGIAP